MNTPTISQFELLDTELLSTVEGGGCSWNGVGGATAQGAIGGAISGAFVVTWYYLLLDQFLGILGGLGGAAAYGATCWWVK